MPSFIFKIQQLSCIIFGCIISELVVGIQILNHLDLNDFNFTIYF